MNVLVDLLADALPRALTEYGSFIESADIAAIIKQRERNLMLRQAHELAEFKRNCKYTRSWASLFQLLTDLLVNR